MDSDEIDFDSLDLEAAGELAKEDPVWQRVLSEAEKVPVVPALRHWGRLTDAVLFIADMLELQAKTKEAIVRLKMQGVPELLPGLLGDLAGGKKDAVERFVLRATQDEMRKKVEQYGPWTLNQGLVILCTRFDVFLEEFLDAIFRKRIELLYSAAEAKSITLKAIVEAGSVEAILGDFRDREIRAFAFEEIEKRFQYLERRVHIETKRVFDWSRFNENVAREFAGWDLKKLVDVYDARHRVVHRDQLPLTHIDELVKVNEFFERLIGNLTVLAREKHGLRADYEAPMLLQMEYQKAKAEAAKTV
jgi:hypothetical protein